MPDTCTPASLPGLVRCARQAIVPIVEQEQLARDTWRIRLAAPDLARDILPGQFLMIREPGTTQPLLGRPFALYDTWLTADGTPAGLDVVYLKVGQMTSLMSTWKAGDPVEVWGPLGNGFPVPHNIDHLLLVAGGIGQTPFMAVAREALGLRRYGHPARTVGTAPRITFCYGARSAEYLAGVSDFRQLGINVQLATDDGSAGQRGFVTEVVRNLLARQQADNTSGRTAIYCCGPEPMMHAVSQLAEQFDIPCWLSLETPMACGFGACFSCVTRVKQDDGTWDYRRVCVEGPVFPAKQLLL